MPIYRCNHCGFISEEANAAIGSPMPCARCGTAATVFGTVFYVEKLVERYFAAMRELKALREAEAEAHPEATASAEAAQGEPAALVGVDLNNTSLLATSEQHAPLQQWFASHQIEARFDYALADTSGFFDDAAQLIGERHELFGELIERIRWAYRKSHTWVNLELGELVGAEVILTHCAELKVTHLGEDDGLLAVDVDPGASSGDTSDGPQGRERQSNRQAVGVFAQHGTPISEGRGCTALRPARTANMQARRIQTLFA